MRAKLGFVMPHATSYAGSARYLYIMKGTKLVALIIGACVVFAAVAAAFTGCNSCTDVKITEKIVHGELEHSVASISVEGMMCQIACGGKIRKELMELPGVANANSKFQAGRDVNFVEVEFNAERVTVEELIYAVEDIADGKLYRVDAVDATHYKR
jgi:copper chaperone CopZ